MAKSSYKVVILSRGRSDTIITHKIMPYADLVVPVSEVKLYKHTNCNIVPIPDELHGLGKVRNWVLDNYQEECIIMADDDIHKVALVSGQRLRYSKDVDYIRQLLENTYVCAKDLGVSLFGFSQRPDVRIYMPNNPFSFNSWVGGVIGVIGRKYRFIENKLKVDIDFFLQNMLRDRIVYVDLRYSFIQERYKNKGGNSIYRTEEQIKKELEILKKRWGKYFIYKVNKTNEQIYVKIPRKQRLIL